MADSTKLLLIGGGVAFAWWQGWLAPLGIPGPSTTIGGFDLSTIPWWGWLAAAGIGFMVLKGGR